MAQWHYSLNDEAQGPIEASELKALKFQGVINDNTMVWCEGMDDWVALKYAPMRDAYGSRKPVAPVDSNNPYAAPVSSINEPRGRRLEDYVLAGRGARLGGAMLDGLIYTACMLPMFIGFGAISGTRGANSLEELISGMMILTSVLFLAVFVMNIVFLYKNAQSIGKKIVGIKIAEHGSGKQCSFSRAFWLRSVVPILIGQIPLIGAIFGLINPFFIFGEERRCLHDQVAGTIVIEA